MQQLTYDKLFGRILTVVNNNVEEVFLLQFGDIKEGSTFSETSIFKNENGKAEIIFKNIDKFNQIISLRKQKPLFLEVFIYENYQNLGFDEFNLFYFLESQTLEEDQEKIDKKVIFSDWEKSIEKGIIVQHNRFYSTLPVDSDGNTIEPEDFNKIYFTNEYYENILNSIYDRNLINPVAIRKGNDPNTSIDNNRKMKAFGSVIIENPSLNQRISYNCEKKSLFEIRQALSNMMLSYGKTKVYKTKIKINQNNKIDLHLIKKTTITINALIQKFQYNFFKNSFSKEKDKNYAIVESDAADFIYSTKLNVKNFEFRNNEQIEKMGLDEEASDKTFPLKDKAEEILRNNKEEELNELGLDYDDYFKSVIPQNIISLSNFKNNNINGDYIIHSVSGIVNQTYIDFSIDELEKI